MVRLVGGTVSAAARRSGFALAAVMTAAMWWLVNIWPGWEKLPFLTSRTTDALAWVNISFLAGIVINVVYAAYDSRWFKALGDVVTTTVGLAATARVWQVFPFDFSGDSFDWTPLVRVVLLVAILGSGIGIAVHVGTLIRLALGAGERRRGEVRR
jgi:hypothetical protein